MNSIRISNGRVLLMVVVCAGVLMLSACQQEKPEIKLVGIWSNFYTFLKYSEDDTFSLAYSVAYLETHPHDWGTYTFDGEIITFYGDEEGVCHGVIGIFEVELSKDGEALFTTVEDSCFGRVRNMTDSPWNLQSP